MLHGSTREGRPRIRAGECLQEARRIFFSNLLHRVTSGLNMRPRFEVWYRS
jgi:hypothetical protein